MEYTYIFNILGLDPKIKSYRRKIAPLFDINFVATTFSILHEKVTFCLENLETFADEEEFDINETLKKLCVDFIAGKFYNFLMSFY